MIYRKLKLPLGGYGKSNLFWIEFGKTSLALEGGLLNVDRYHGRFEGRSVMLRLFRLWSGYFVLGAAVLAADTHT